MEMLVSRLEDFGNESSTPDLRIERINSELWEIKAKGNVLGNINVRAFFAEIRDRSEVVVLGAFKKENNDATRPHRIDKMRNRRAHYLRITK
jgi:hypothetical protein